MPRLLFALVALLVSLPAFSQESETPPLWDSNAELSLLLTSGNTEVSTLGVGLGSIFRPDPWTVKGKGSYLTSSNFGAKTAELFSVELRGERKITETLSGFLSSAYLKNKFSGFQDRLGAEAGVSYLLLQQDGHSLNTELGAGLIKENRTDNTNQTFATARVGLDYKWKFSETSDVSNNLSFLDNLKTTRDWRLSDTLSVTTLMTSVLSLKLSFKIDHLNVPVTAKKSTDTTTMVSLIAKF